MTTTGRQYSTLLAAALAAAATSACDSPDTPNVPSPTPPKAETASAPAGPAAMASETSLDTLGTIQKGCQGTSFRISQQSAQSDSADAPRSTQLSRVPASGMAEPIADPAEMKGYTAVGLGCADSSQDGKAYFVVQYGELPNGCKFCEWFYLYDETGLQLTTSAPPILVDQTLPSGQQQSANTREYETLIKKLGLTHPEMSYVE